MGEVASVVGSGGAMAVAVVESGDPRPVISRENWGLAEAAAREVIHGVHPTMDTDERRSSVIDHLQRLFKSSLGFEIFSYGSVPLKTYLPDGDIDLTILSSGPGAEATWANDVLTVLKWEEANQYAEFKVTDLHLVDAEVKILKCIVQNIVIDISFNQFGGVCTLCFLEQVDRIIGRDHLFKRSILLIKAWCYYESRILGAHHGLLSTYALETLVLYIFQLFHASLEGPLSVLYKFLDYFSKFDWDNFCITLKGPVLKSCLPAVGPLEEDSQMLSDEFLRNCIELFAMTPLGEEETTNTKKFTPKHINIVDPLREYNNLGRSVNKGNFYRIRSALKYGARKLENALTLPKDEVEDEINHFFHDIINRHESKCETFVKEYAAALSIGGSATYLSQHALLPGNHMQLMPPGTESEYDPRLMGERNNTYYSGSYSARYASSLPMPGFNHPTYRFNRNASDVGRYIQMDGRTSTTTSDCSPSSNPSISSLGQYGQVPMLSLTNPSSKNAYSSQIDTWECADEKAGLDTWLEGKANKKTGMANGSQPCSDSLDDYSPCSSGLSSPKSDSLESLSLDFRELDISSGDESEPLHPLADLTGDYDSHIRSLLHGPFFHKFELLQSTLLQIPAPPSQTPAPPLQFESNQAWYSAPQSMPSEYGRLHTPPTPYTPPTPLQYESSQQWLPVSQQMPSEQPAYHHQMYQSNVSLAPPPGTASFPSEDPQKARGTGTYLPNMDTYNSWDQHDYVQSNDVQYIPYVPLKEQLSRPSSASSWRHGQSQRYSSGSNYNPPVSEINNSPRGYPVSEISNSPRGYPVPEVNNSPRGFPVPEVNNSPRGLPVSEVNNSARGFPVSEVNNSRRGFHVSEVNKFGKAYPVSEINNPAKGYSIPEIKNPPKGYSVPEIKNPPKGYYVPEIKNPPKGYYVPEINNPPKGYPVPEINNPSKKGYYVSEMNNPPKGYSVPEMNNPSKGYSVSGIYNRSKPVPEYHPVYAKKKTAVPYQPPQGKERPSRAKSPQSIEFGSVGNLVEEVHSSCGTASKKQLDAPLPSVNNAEAKVAAKPFVLKNEDEFPPLSV